MSRQGRYRKQNKMTSEDDIKGLVSLKFLRPCFTLSADLYTVQYIQNVTHITAECSAVKLP